MKETDKAAMLAKAMPYIQKYSGKTVVIKYGGHAMGDDALFKSVMGDLILLQLVGVRVVVVHGGGPEISEVLGKIGKKSVFVDGLRYTDGETLDVAQMVLCGKINKNLVNAICRLGGRAIGLSGVDGAMLKACQLKRPDGSDIGLVGEIEAVDPAPLNDLLACGYIPVISTIAYGTDGNAAYNVNADTAASKIAVGLAASKLILLTDVKGLLRDPKDDSTLIPKVTLGELPALVKEGIISGGMIPKIDCCADAVKGGTADALILDGRVPHSILLEMLTDEGSGTMVLP